MARLEADARSSGTAVQAKRKPRMLKGSRVGAAASSLSRRTAVSKNDDIVIETDGQQPVVIVGDDRDADKNDNGRRNDTTEVGGAGAGRGAGRSPRTASAGRGRTGGGARGGGRGMRRGVVGRGGDVSGSGGGEAAVISAVAEAMTGLA
jgi:hypothetical protein